MRDEALVSAMAKLAKTEHPISVPRHKYLLEDLRKEAARLQDRLKHGDLVPMRPGPSANWARRLLGRFRLQRQPLLDEVLEKQLAEIKERTEKLDRQQIVGILTPLTIQEEHECEAHFYATRRGVGASFQLEDSTAQQRQFEEEALDFASNHALLAKRLECSLKKSVWEERDGERIQVLIKPLQRALTAKSAREIEPRIAGEIYQEYMQAFELTGDEVKK